MPNLYIENAEKWKALASIDYFTHFVKAWIPFNAWYRNAYPALDNDAEIMKEIKSNYNNFRNRIVSLIQNPVSQNDSKIFKEHIADLHYQLERNHVHNKGVRISFTSIFIEENSHLIERKIHRGFSYNVQVNNGNRKIIVVSVVDRLSVTRLTINQSNGYDWGEIENHVLYSTLPPECKRVLKSCYQEVDPRKSITLLTEDNTNSIKIGNYDFINDPPLIAKAIITVIYNLRNSLFHGQLVPDKNTQLVYRPAYSILSMLVDEL